MTAAKNVRLWSIISISLIHYRLHIRKKTKLKTHYQKIYSSCTRYAQTNVTTEHKSSNVVMFPTFHNYFNVQRMCFLCFQNFLSLWNYKAQNT